MSFTKVALVGATGNVGPAIHKALLDAGFEVTILSREGSTSCDSLPSHPKQKIVKVNLEDVDAVAAALQGVEGIVTSVNSHALLSQRKIADGAIAAGVKRFIPSDFGADLAIPNGKTVPFNMDKVTVHGYLEEKAKSNPNFSYTYICNGPFFDWCLKKGIYGNLKDHDMTLWDGGDVKCTSTTLATVGKAVATVFKNPEATKNQELYIADTTITQKEILEIVKEIDGKEWTTKPGSTDETYQKALDELKKPEKNMMVAIMGQLYKIMFDTAYGSDFSNKLDNDKLGLRLMTKEQVKEVVKSCMP